MRSTSNQYSGVCKKCGAIVEMHRGLVHHGVVYCYPCAPIPTTNQNKIRVWTYANKAGRTASKQGATNGSN